MTYQENSNNPEGNRRGDDPTRWCQVKLNGVGDSVPPDEGCEVLDGEVNDEEWNKNDNKDFADCDDTNILVKWGEGHYKML